MSIVQLIADIWDEAQQTNRPMTIRKYKQAFEKEARERFVVTRTPSLEGVPHQSLLRLRADIVRVFEMTEKQFTSRNRSMPIVYPRHIFHYLARMHQISSYKHIASISGLDDHATIISSVRRVRNLLETCDPVFIKYWHAYLVHGDPYFTSICRPQVTLSILEHKKPAVYSNSTPYGIAWRTDV